MDADGNWITDGNQVKAMVRNFWKELFQEEPNVGGASVPILRDYFPEISTEEREKLARPFSSCEVLATLKDMKPYKAPGPDGFQSVFYQKFWNLVLTECYKISGRCIDWS